MLEKSVVKKCWRRTVLMVVPARRKLQLRMHSLHAAATRADTRRRKNHYNCVCQDPATRKLRCWRDIACDIAAAAGAAVAI